MSAGDLVRRRTAVGAITMARLERPAPPGTRQLAFLHGLGASALDFTWLARQPDLAKTRLLLIDAAGHGESDRPEIFSYTIEAHAELVAGLLLEVATQPLALVGHSMGGSTAIAIAHRHPNLVTHLVVAEPNLDPAAGSLSGHIARQGEDRFVSRGYTALRFQTERAAARGDAVGQAFLRSLRLASPVALHRSASSLRAERSPTFREHFEALSLPRTVLWGERTPPLDPPLADPAIRQVAIPDAGHQVMVDNPDAFAAAIREALTQP